MSESFDPVADLRRALEKAAACEAHPPLRQSKSWEEADLWAETVEECAPDARKGHLRFLALNDLFFLLVHILGRRDIAGFSLLDPFAKRDEKAANWYFARCKEVQESPDGHLDFWSRFAGKSTIITFGRTIQDILANPNETICIFSHNDGNAQKFLRQIKTEFEDNERLKTLFPDVLWADPKRESPKWSEKEGIVVKRSINVKEATVEAHGLVEALPTGPHFSKLVYDDVVTEDLVSNPQMIDKVTQRWELSINLAATRPARFRVVGTFYDEGDTYHVMVDRGFGKPRIRPAVTPDGRSDLWSEEGVAQLKQAMTTRNYAMQILMDPKQAEKERGFKKEWWRTYKQAPPLKSMNRYVLVDPAGGGPNANSFTAIVAVGLFVDRNKYVLDIVRDKIGLVQRVNHLFDFVDRYEPLAVIYESYGMQADIEHIEERMKKENRRFTVIEVGGTQHSQHKDIRIEKLQPDFRDGTILFPEEGIRRKNSDGKEEDLVDVTLRYEYLPFPATRFKDVLDALSRMKDQNVNLVYPKRYGSKESASTPWGQGHSGDPGGWMSS